MFEQRVWINGLDGMFVDLTHEADEISGALDLGEEVSDIRVVHAGWRTALSAPAGGVVTMGAAGGDGVKVGDTAGAGRLPNVTMGRRFADFVGITKFRNDCQDIRNAKGATAAYQGLDPIDDDNVTVVPKLSIMEACKQAVDTRMGGRNHNTRHRAANRFNKRIKMVKILVEKVAYSSPSEFTKSAADKRCLNLVVRQVIDDAFKAKTDLGGVTLHERELNWVRRAVNVAYFIKDGDSKFFDGLMECGDVEPE